MVIWQSIHHTEEEEKDDKDCDSDRGSNKSAFRVASRIGSLAKFYSGSTTNGSELKFSVKNYRN